MNIENMFPEINYFIEHPEHYELLYSQYDAIHNEYALDEEEAKKIMNCINKLQQENQQLKNNWNELKEYIEKTKIKEFEKSFGKRYSKTFTQAEIIVCNMIKDKIKELEREE